MPCILTRAQPVAAHQVDQQAGQGEEAGQDRALARRRQHKRQADDLRGGEGAAIPSSLCEVVSGADGLAALASHGCPLGRMLKPTLLLWQTAGAQDALLILLRHAILACRSSTAAAHLLVALGRVTSDVEVPAGTGVREQQFGEGNSSQLVG